MTDTISPVPEPKHANQKNQAARSTPPNGICTGPVTQAFMARMKPRCQDSEIIPPAALFFHIFMLNSVLERAANRVAEQHGLTMPQWMALGCVANGEAAGVTHSELGHRLMLSKAPITGVVDRLERGGYVQRTTDGKDRRVSNIVITPKGQETWLVVRSELRALATERCSSLSDEELQTMLTLLGRLLESAAEADPILSGLSSAQE